MKKMLAGALFGLVILGAERAEANMKLNLSVRSCDNGGAPWKQTDQDGRLGRLTIEDQGGAVVQTETNVHFSASRCQATFTVTFTDATMARFRDPDDPLFLKLEACKNGQVACTFAAGQLMDDKPVVFADSAIDSLLPDLSKLHTDELMAEIEERIAAGNVETAARIAADQAELERATAAEQGLRDGLALEITRATAAEQLLDGGLLAEVNRAITAELAEAAAREQGLAAEAAARIAAIQAEATLRAAADQAELTARVQAIADEAAARTTADDAEAAARTAADDAEAAARTAADDAARAYVDDTFLAKAGGTIDGELVVTGMLRLQGGVSWDACPAGLDAAEHEFPAAGGGSNRLCASDYKNTAPSVQINKVLGSYIAPICPLVVQVVQNYTEVGGPAAIRGVNTLLQTVTGLLNDQITPFAQGLLDATTDVTNDLIDDINGKVGEVNALLAAHTAGINDVIAAYNGLVANVNTALATSTNGLNGSIAAINTYLAGVRSNINSVVAGINGAVGDVNGAFAAIDASLGSTSDALNALNNSPTGINSALGTLTTTLNARIGTINGLLDSISTAQSSIVGGFNSGVDRLRANFGVTVDYINELAGNVRSQIIGPLNTAIDVLDAGAINVGNYLVGPLNVLIGPKSHTNRAGINGVLSWVQSTTLGAVNFPWFEPLPTIQSTTATGMADINLSWSIGSYLPSPGVVSAPAALAHVSTVGAPTVTSLGLPTFDLGLNASMRTVAHNLDAPGVAGVQAPQITGATVGAVAAPAIPAIPYVAIPAIPAFGGFQLVGAIDFDAISALIGSTMDPICADVAGTAQSYLDAFLEEVPALVPAYADAEEVCGSLGAHVCSATEIMLLVGDDGSPEDLTYGLGDWTGDGLVMFNPKSTSGLMVEVAWPFLHPDASKLMTFPPGFPFTFTPPVVPTGNFRCCASSAAFE